ncbi:MAG TPA: TetR/AcrR family transcriptional regulator [Tenuifilaceae bacterium]|nr:TetR/AcrR family transcriptional regulator [Tenuifilaceae bacterium]HRX32029.1 TetR/AcrR family transcriptional regulator [Tenuifilaceae bacterium]
MDTRQGNATRQKIMETARELFIAKGVDRVGVREIALKAEVNLSLMNYYFQSKENLLEQIFEDSIKDTGHKLKQILNADVTLDVKIKNFIDFYVDILREDPLLVPFVLSIIHRNAEQAPRLKAVSTLYNTEAFSKQVRAEIESGNIRPTDPEQLFISMISLILFPFAIKPLVKYRMALTDSDMEKFLMARKEHIYNIIMCSIKK